jgi:hypothetical protein
MAHFKKWSTTAAFGAAVCLAGVMGVGAGMAGAGAPNPFRQSSPAVNPGVALVPGTYNWIVNGSSLGTITFASGNTWTSSFDSDSGEWVQAGKSFAMDMTGGTDGPAGCLFAAKVGLTGTSIVKGAYHCSNTGVSGTWSASPAASAAPAAAHGDVFAAPGVAPRASIVLGTYNWFVNGSDVGTITYAAGDTWSSSYIGAGGAWVQGGNTMAMTMTSGGAGSGGCIFVGKVAITGTAVSSASKPGAWICPGLATHGIWYVS